MIRFLFAIGFAASCYCGYISVDDRRGLLWDLVFTASLIGMFFFGHACIVAFD